MSLNLPTPTLASFGAVVLAGKELHRGGGDEEKRGPWVPGPVPACL